MLLEKLYLDAKSPCVYTVYGRKISLRLVQLNLVSLGTKENYKEGKEIFLVIVLLCFVNCLVASGSKAAGLRQFSKVRSSKRDFVDRCTFHCCCTLILQLCMLQKFEFYPNCRIRKCESVFILVFIKTLRPSWSYSSIGPCSNILICKKNYVYNVHSCCTFRLAIL